MAADADVIIQKVVIQDSLVSGLGDYVLPVVLTGIQRQYGMEMQVLLPLLLLAISYI